MFYGPTWEVAGPRGTRFDRGNCQETTTQEQNAAGTYFAYARASSGVNLRSKQGPSPPFARRKHSGLRRAVSGWSSGRCANQLPRSKARCLGSLALLFLREASFPRKAGERLPGFVCNAVVVAYGEDVGFVGRCRSIGVVGADSKHFFVG